MRAMITLFVFVLFPVTALGQLDTSLIHGIHARSIGPAGMSGRVAAIDVVVRDPNVIYVGSATGGLWKSVDAGLTWKPVFDDQHTSSIGAVAVFQASPDVVWVGTGEGNPRNSAGVGYGIYKSMDGGRTWAHLGLERSERIHRIRLHPTDPNVAYVAALGPTWSDGEERGVFKTTDGGRTWRRVLYVNERTGAAELVMDPTNPNKLFAAMWEHRREPWFFESGGPGSGLYVTYDGGETWRRLTADDGLPSGNLGRIGIAIARSRPEVVYALVEATRSALVRSDDGGHSWRTINDSAGVAPRPFYYADIRVDPLNENRLYSIHGRCTVSEDGGQSFETVVPSSVIHGDVHELWIHPEDNRMLLMGNDGGVGISRDRGESWRFVENLPLAQFYHINVDMETPYNVYGGMQDNGSWFGPSSVWLSGGIRNYYWTRVGSGDGFATLNDFADSRYGYSMSQQGFLRRFDKVTGERKDIRPVHPEGVELRFNWNAAIAVDPFDSATIYFGSQFVHKTTDHGNTWEIISPDLTTNDPAKQRQAESGGLTRDATGAENHTTIVTISPSPVERGVIWVGTDDGNVQLTVDGGRSWVNVADRIRSRAAGRLRGSREVPPNTWVPHIEASKFAGGAAFVIFDDHRRGNWTTYVFKTTDYGESWQSLATDQIRGFAHVIEQDPVESGLLFLGTEFGMYVSTNGGRDWTKWTRGLPTVPVRALVVHPRDHDLVIGTHGRGAFILGDLRFLRRIAAQADITERPLHVFNIPATYQHEVPDAVGYRSTGHSMFSGENKEYGASVTYWFGAADSGEVEIEIEDARGELVRAIEHEAARGLNRMVWDLRREAFTAPASRGSTEVRHEVPPGNYTLRLTYGDHEASAPLTIRPDPRLTLAAEAYRDKYAMLDRVGARIEVAYAAVERAREVLDAVDLVTEATESREDSVARGLRADGDSLRAAMDAVIERFVEPPGRQGIFRSGLTVSSKLRSVYFSLQSSWDVPTEAQELAFARAEEALRESLEELNRLLMERVAPYAERVRAAGITPLPELGPVMIGGQRGSEGAPGGRRSSE